MLYEVITALRRAPGTRNYVTPQISLYRFDENGLEISHQTISLDSGQGGTDELVRLLKLSLAGGENQDEPFLLMRRVSRDFPDSILTPGDRATFDQVRHRIVV